MRGMLTGPITHQYLPPSLARGCVQLNSTVKRVSNVPTREETEVQAVVGCIVWPFRKLKKPRSWERSASSHALHSVCTQIFGCLLLSFVYRFVSDLIQYCNTQLLSYRLRSSAVVKVTHLQSRVYTEMRFIVREVRS